MNFSALASVYSGEKPEYLDQALESLYKQTLQADEIVIVHDGPLTKGLYSCLEKWRSYLPLKEIKLRQQRSLGPALNVGIKECFHELIARFDTDDINHPKRFEMQIKHLEKNLKTSVLGTWSQHFTKNPKDSNQIHTLPIHHKDIKKYAIYCCSPINHPSVIFRKKDILSVGGYSNKFSRMGDYDLWLRMLARGYLFENIPEALCYYRYASRCFLKGNFRINFKKTWGFSLFQLELLLYKRKKQLNMSCGYRGFLFSLKRLFTSLSPLSIHYSSSKKWPQQ